MHSGISNQVCRRYNKRESFVLKERPRKIATAIIRFEVSGSQVEKVLSQLPGIKDYNINHVNGTFRVEYDPEDISSDKIRKSVNKQI